LAGGCFGGAAAGLAAAGGFTGFAAAAGLAAGAAGAFFLLASGWMPLAMGFSEPLPGEISLFF
jgi:hypothetical protein